MERTSHFSQLIKNKQDIPKILENKVIANIFFENSTRTKLSFELAAKRLGAIVINFDAASSSLAKGESLEDTLRIFEAFGIDIGIIRHKDDSYIDSLKSNQAFSIINAGAGKLEHPSQSLLDLFTIKEEFKDLNGLTITICGDITNSRVAKSNINILKHFGCKILLCGPKEFLLSQDEIQDHCKVCPIDEAIKKTDVLMLLRVQHERHGLYEFNIENYNQEFGLNSHRMKMLKENAIIMHPGPFNRGVEIESDLVEHPQSRIFKQKENGVYTRMAILEWILA